MARLVHHKSTLVAPAIISLLLLVLAALAAGPAAAQKVRIQYAGKGESEWLDRYAETHQLLGAGPLRMVRATPEQEHWLNRLSKDVGGTTEDGEDGAGAESGGYIDMDDDNPYLQAVRDWASHLIKQSMEKAGSQAENPFQDL